MIKKVVLSLLLVFSVQFFAYAQSEEQIELPKISYKNNSISWHNRNDHLIPSGAQTEEILLLDQERDFASDDIDADGVVNNIDPSAYDWREIGYQPFGVLAFLGWRHDWNDNKYSEENLEEAVKLLNEAGISFVRMDFLWEDVESKKGKFNFQKYDFIVDLLSKKSIRALGILDYSTFWSADAWNNPPKNLDDFAAYVFEIVSRYKHRIKYWEIWNEPDSPIYWQPQDDMKTYTELLKKSYEAAKKADPTCKVVLGGMTSEGYYAIKSVYANGGKDYFDLINIHPFVDPLNPNEIKKIYTIYNNLERLKAQYNDKDKKIWFTEIGCPGVGADKESKGWWMGQSASEEQQAQFLYIIYTDIIELPNLEKVFWAYFRDNNAHFKNDVDYFGLVRWDFSKKPAFDVLKDRHERWLNLHSYLKLQKKYGR
ncbi:cellulase family glycosylhydrolase [Candidatus Omnitrophota bacterium]